MPPRESTDERWRPQRTELVWKDKRTEVQRVALPFQVVETINVSRATREETPLFVSGKLIEDPLFAQGSANPSGADGWRNKLIWGDNKYVLASLLEGDPAIGLEPLAGKVDLIYIDPPFDTGDDFSYRVRIGDVEVGKEPSLIEEKAYRDMWGDGRDLGPYLQMLYERLLLMRELLRPSGSMYLHVGPNVSHYVKAVLDEVFGYDNYRNEVVWKRADAHNDPRRYGNIHDAILFYTKGPGWTWNPENLPLPESTAEAWYRYEEVIEKDIVNRLGMLLKAGTVRRYNMADITGAGANPNDRPWRGVMPPPGRHWAYSRERMEELEREGRIIYSGSGRPYEKRYLDESKGIPPQTVWVDIPQLRGIQKRQAESEWLDFDTQKPEALVRRLVMASSLEGDLVADFFCGSGTTMAVAEKLGRRWIGCDLGRFAIHVSRKRLLDIPNCRPFQILNLGKYERQHWQGVELGEGIQHYLDFIVELYKGEPVRGFVHLHGRKAGRMVHVGATEAPVTLSEIKDTLEECAANNLRGLDVLGWEWEMGLHDIVTVEARKRGVDLRLLTIPREVMDKRAVESGDVHFYELAYLDVDIRPQDGAFQVALRNFVIPNEELVPQDVREKITRWSDYVDFWAVDWDYQGDTFHNQWQSYRTRKHPALRLDSDPHTYDKPGRYQVMVKVIDIFGNDTTKLLSASVT